MSRNYKSLKDTPMTLDDWYEFIEKGKACMLFGLPIKDYDRDSLFYVIGLLSQLLEDVNEEYIHDMDLMSKMSNIRYSSEN